ncbi:MAG TPA: bacillithiol biosynthesis cysteine-adding enzyme BshC [Candidatus Hydrogenedens sp.]|nr:bacillithiol biosynthesis cysteine-adding enzyme BshC [Candidatus Hydrogenedens sp.]
MNKLYQDFLLSRDELRQFYPWLPIDSVEKLTSNINVSTSLNIISGQQPAIFGGPLYTIYKIITLIKLSQHLGKNSGKEVKPIFWVHSWDHDWQEACSVSFLTYDYETFRFVYEPEETEKGKPLYKLELNRNIFTEQIPEIFKRIKGSEYSSFWEKFLISSLSSSKNLSDWSTAILKEEIKDENLFWFEPHKNNDFKVLQNLIEIAIENHQNLINEFNKTSDLLKKMGYKLQVHKSLENAFFFLDENNYRSRINFVNGVFISERSGKEYSNDELKHILKYEPERFSPNLIFRCIYQQIIFPCIIYVGGPAEIAYWAQLKDLFSFLKLQMPVIFPRKRFAVVPMKIGKWMSEMNIGLKDIPKLYRQKTENLSYSISMGEKEKIENAREKYKKATEIFLKELTTIFNIDNSFFDKQGKTFLSRIENETQKLIETIIKMQSLKNEQFQKHLSSILRTILPDGIEQERVFSPLCFISEFGDNFIKKIAMKMDITNFDIEVVEL